MCQMGPCFPTFMAPMWNPTNTKPHAQAYKMFEWAWQHPKESLAVRNAAASFKSLSGVANKIKLAYTMLTLPAWQSLNLTVNFFSTKYTKYSAGCPRLPEHMKVQVCPMDELPHYIGGGQALDESKHIDGDKSEDDKNFNGGDQVKEALHVKPVYNSGDKTTGDKSEHTEDDGFCLLKDPQNREGEDDRMPVCIVGSLASPSEAVEIIEDRNPLRISSSSIISPLDTEEMMEGRNPFSLNEESNNSGKSDKHLQTPNAADDDQAPSAKRSLYSPEVEIINLLSPSPDCVTYFYRKKKRASCPQIIDLTKSPTFIQL
uniref:Uncharacterized protein n=1 Tax=Nelumbo nucifera TaxID=4432 RepID=A0A822Z1V4_NELNU|nr:TPA_asm: hypothetical protein HUJ06_012982 [Nelumbo nucifera]